SAVSTLKPIILAVSNENGWAPACAAGPTSCARVAATAASRLHLLGSLPILVMAIPPLARNLDRERMARSPVRSPLGLSEKFGILARLTGEGGAERAHLKASELHALPSPQACH